MFIGISFVRSYGYFWDVLWKFSLDWKKKCVCSSDLPPRENLTCEASIEIPYHSSQMFIMEGKYPLCDYCKQQGHSPLFKWKRKLLPSSVFILRLIMWVGLAKE
jgi:hypothetical protein